jgi:hypothetical protein
MCRIAESKESFAAISQDGESDLSQQHNTNGSMIYSDFVTFFYDTALHEVHCFSYFKIFWNLT